mgnify:FL=1
MREIRAKRFAPIYVLMGQEPYFIDCLSKALEQNVLSDDERDFNQTILYGAEATPDQVMDAAGRYPMMAERQLVILREAQAMKDKLEQLVPYAQNPNQSTVLVICFKHGTLDRRRKLASVIAKTGVIFESNKLWDNQLPTFVNNYLKERGRAIERSACDLLCEYVGADLTRLANEMDKLLVALGPDVRETSIASNPTVKNPSLAPAPDIREAPIAPSPKVKKPPLAPAPDVREISISLVAEQIGQSKEYNAFSLIDALVNRDVTRSMRIVAYFGTNPKGFALQPVTAALFTFFSNLLLSYYSPDKSEGGVASFVGVNPTNARHNLIPAQKQYSGRKVLQIIRFIRVIDARSKGVECPNTSDFDLLRDLVYFILH